MRSTSINSATLALAFCWMGCSGTEDSGASTAVGGNLSAGGMTGSGGSASGLGGLATVGGANPSVGGTPVTSTVFAGGSTTTLGGSGAALGGTPSTGGIGPLGGSPGVGGSLASGGSKAAGGSLNAGGSLAAGGSKATGGSLATGGSKATGGTSSSKGGSSPAGGVTSAAGGSTLVTSKPTEDSGLDCTVGALPDTGSLPTNAKLPDPFKKLDGTRVAAKAEWHCRREEILKLAEKFAYGTKGIPQTVTGTVTNSSITVNISSGGKTASFSVAITLPSTGTAPYPAVVVYGGFADNATILAAGAATINMDPNKLGAEGTGRASKSGAYYTINGASSTTGLLQAWGWGVSRIIDVIEKSDGKILRADGIGVTGCSRYGKGAIIAGAFDERVALTMPIESGTAGVPIWRGVPGEGAQSLSSAYGEQPWFGDAFSAFTSTPTKAPLDTHELLALVAPRGLFVMDNPHIANLGPKSAHAAALAGAEVYKALGAGENLTYWSNVADGSHCANRPEWKEPLTRNIQKFLLKSGSYSGVINPHSKATSTLATWVDWTTPTLN